MNIADSALPDGDPQRLAVVTMGEGAKERRYTIAQLSARVQEVARGLLANGVQSGDAVAIDMPMTYESVAIYLGIVFIGAAAVSIADSFAPAEIATRLRIADAKAIFTQDVIIRGDKRIPLYDRVCEADAPKAFVIAADDTLSVSLRVGDLSYEDLIASGFDGAAPQSATCDANAPTNILFSSGTTGDPKAVVWTHITPIKAATDGWAHHDIRSGDVVAWPTNLGWMMGPWLIYASLLNGAAIALYDGSPLGRGFTEFVRDVKVTMLGVVPSLVRAWRNNGATDGVDWSTIRCFSSTGEASKAEDMLWLMSRAGYKPVVEYCGGTEIGGGYICGNCVQPQAPSAFSTPAIGSAFVILDDAGQPAEEGELALVPPMLGSSDRLLNRDHQEVYFADMPPGPDGDVLRRHGDHVGHLGGGYYRALGRVDDTMNLGGIKTSSADIERVLASLDGIVETAAIAVAPDGGPSQLVIYAVVEEESGHSAELLVPIFQQRMKSDLNPLFKISDVVVVDALPRTASNKVMRRVLRDRYRSG
jgi:acetyl-CoA synthetase